MKDNALYLEADEDVTSAIDKLAKAEGSSVQIVVPKRSTMLQSIINLKLLKKAAATAGKELVLVTNDHIATELAARVGLAVAPSLGAKPVIHEAEIPATLKGGEEIIEADEPEPSHEVAAAVAAATAGKTAAKRPLLKFRPLADKPATPAVPPAAPIAAGPADTAADAAAPAAKPGGPRVPNFAKLQRRALWFGLAVFLVVGYFAAMFFLQSATVTLYANGTKVDIDTTFAVDPALKSTDKAKAVLAGQTVTVSKDLSGSFTPTGKKDAGTKAGGQVTMYNEYDVIPHTIVAGTQLVAPDGKVFRTKSDATIPGATVGLSGGKFTLTPGKSDAIAVEADQSGDTYNEGPARYTVKNYTGDMQAKIYGQGAQMSGGTTKTVTVVTQTDVDTAKAAILDKDKDNAGRDLKSRVPSGYVALEPSQTSATDTVTPSPAVEAEGATGNLALKVTYTVLAVKESEYHDLVRAQELKQIGDKNQIYDDGIGAAEITTSDKDATGRQTFHLTTEAFGGVKIDTTAVAAQVKGKRYGDAVDLANRQPGVSRAEVTLKPSWSTSLPGRTDKIKVVIQVAANK
jgi:hypothetical protein